MNALYYTLPTLYLLYVNNNGFFKFVQIVSSMEHQQCDVKKKMEY